MNVLLPRTSLQPARSASDLFEEFDRLRNQLLGGVVAPEARVGGWTPALADLEEQDDEFVIEVADDNAPHPHPPMGCSTDRRRSSSGCLEGSPRQDRVRDARMLGSDGGRDPGRS